MIDHLVLLKIKDTNAIATIVNELKQLQSKISEIKSLSVGENFCDRNKGFQVGLRVTFDSQEDLDKYQIHPEHQRVLNNFIKPHLEDVIAVDYCF
ncbi:MAG: Dabb family protein [Bacteriovoracaceae bacterium]